MGRKKNTAFVMPWQRTDFRKKGKDPSAFLWEGGARSPGRKEKVRHCKYTAAHARKGEHLRSSVEEGGRRGDVHHRHQPFILSVT